MPEKKEDAGFTVTDRRLFTADGELRTEAVDDKPPPLPQVPPRSEIAAETSVANPNVPPRPALPSRKPTPTPTTSPQRTSTHASNLAAIPQKTWK